MIDEPEQFKLSDEVLQAASVRSPESAAPESRAASPLTGGASVSEADALRDEPEAGRLLAEDMETLGYQPIILFGNAASGKTSLLLSLFATIKTEAALEAGLFLGDPILDTARPYGRYLWEQASHFFGLKTQEFIEGKASPRTNIELPFFIPVIFRPNGRPEMRFAFMESNGEWYRPDRSGNRFFPPLRKQVEEFLASYQGGVLFIHLLPYTQRALYTSRSDGSGDAALISEASLAVSGALQAYDAVRLNKRNDYHIMLVTKWDAHRSEGGDEIDALMDYPDEVEDLVSRKYSQAYVTYRGLGLPRNQLCLNGYCSGLMSEDNILRLTGDDEKRGAVLRYPINLWRWIYRTTSFVNDGAAADPFPTNKSGSAFPRGLGRILDRFF